MKTKKITNALFLLPLIAGIMTSCVKDDDFDTPDVEITEPELDADIISINAVLSELEQQNGEQYTFETENYMEGYVISSDEGGNFFREIILQDKAEDPTAGIKVSLFVNPLYTHYQIGQKIYVKLKGFTIGTSNGLVTLGIPDGNFIGEAPESYQNNIVRSPEIAEIVPKPLTIEEFSDQYESMFIRLEGVKFTAEDALGDNPKTFASENDDEFDGERVLENCNNDATTIFSTSTFADFKASKLPEGSGDIAGILARNFSDDYYVISVNTPEDILFEEERCGEENGNFNPTDPLSLPFEEDFEAQTAGIDEFVNILGWDNINVNGGNRRFEVREFSNNKYAQTTAFNSEEDPYEVWLVSPEVNVSSTSMLSFDSKDGYYNGDALSVYISTDYQSDPQTATWTELSASLSTGNTDDYGDNFMPSGDIDLSTYTGQDIRIGFKYEGGENGTTTTYQIDNVLITE